MARWRLLAWLPAVAALRAGSAPYPPRAKFHADLCRRLPLAEDPLDGCIARSMRQLEEIAGDLLEVLHGRAGKLGPLGYPIGPGPQKDADACDSPCSGPLAEAARLQAPAPPQITQCARLLDDIWKKVCNSTALHRATRRAAGNWRREIGWHLSRIGEFVPSVGEQLLAFAREQGMFVILRACSITRLEYCFEMLRARPPPKEAKLHLRAVGDEAVASLYLQKSGAEVVGRWLLRACSNPAPDADAADLPRVVQAAPYVITVLAKWFQEVCTSFSKKCKQASNLVTNLCFRQELQGAIGEECSAAFAGFAVWRARVG